MVNIDELIDFEHLKYNWDKIELVPEFAKLKECQQSPKWHAEGNAWIHTQKVCEKVISLYSNYRKTNMEYPLKVLMTAALFHDIGKGVTTFEKDGKWHSYGHEIAGEKIARELLWDTGYEFREEVCALVRWHMCPLSILSEKNYLERIVTISKLIAHPYLLCALKRCDIIGSEQPNMDDSKAADMEKIMDLSRIMRKIGCLEMPATLPEKGHYPSDKAAERLGKKHLTVYVLVGLAGAGKSTFIKHIESIYANVTAISRDTIRTQLGYCGEGEKMVGSSEQEAKVSAEFDSQIKKAAKEGKVIVIDNLNTKRKYRDGYKNLLKDYCVVWNYAYIEAPSLKDNIERRKGQISEEIFKNMIVNFDWPQPDEYDTFTKRISK